MTPAQMKSMAEQTVAEVKLYVARALTPLQDRMVLLEARIRQLERESDDRKRTST